MIAVGLILFAAVLFGAVALVVTYAHAEPVPGGER
jgi:hypothetical protein